MGRVEFGHDQSALLHFDDRFPVLSGDFLE